MSMYIDGETNSARGARAFRAGTRAGALALFMTTALSLIPGGAFAQTPIETPAIGLLHGVRPEVVSGGVMRFTDGTATSRAGTLQMNVTSFRDTGVYLQLDVNTVGLNGRDAGGLGDGHFYFYLLKETCSATVGIIASRSTTYEGVTLPPGGPWAMRKLPYGHPFRAEFSGFPPVHLDGWPQPTAIFTNAEYSGGNVFTWTPLFEGAATVWTNVDVSKWLPDNARLGHFIFQVRKGDQFVAGSCYVRTSSAQPTGVLIGSATPNVVFDTASTSVQVDASRRFQYRCTSGVNLVIQTRGFSISE